MAGFFGLTQTPDQGPLYGAQVPRNPLVASLMGHLGGNLNPVQSNIGSAFSINPMMAMRLANYLQQPSNNIPGTGFLGTSIGGIPYAQGAAPGPNQIEPM